MTRKSIQTALTALSLTTSLAALPCLAQQSPADLQVPDAHIASISVFKDGTAHVSLDKGAGGKCNGSSQTVFHITPDSKHDAELNAALLAMLSGRSVDLYFKVHSLANATTPCELTYLRVNN